MSVICPNCKKAVFCLCGFDPEVSYPDPTTLVICAAKDRSDVIRFVGTQPGIFPGSPKVVVDHHCPRGQFFHNGRMFWFGEEDGAKMVYMRTERTA